MYRMVVKERTSEEQTGFSTLCLLGLVLLASCAGCARNRGALFVGPDAPVVWPDLPEQPRIRYLGTLSTEADLKQEVSWTEGFGELLFGKKEIGVLVGPYATT